MGPRLTPNMWGEIFDSEMDGNGLAHRTRDRNALVPLISDSTSLWNLHKLAELGARYVGHSSCEANTTWHQDYTARPSSDSLKSDDITS